MFEGGFDWSAAEAVLDLGAGGPWALDVLQELVDASLVRVDASSGRLSTWVVVGEFARDRLQADPAAAAEARHGRHYACLGADSEELARESDNLVSACRRAAARGDGAVALRALERAGQVFALQGPYPSWVALAAAVQAMALSPAQEVAARVEVAASLLTQGRQSEIGTLLAETLRRLDTLAPQLQEGRGASVDVGHRHHRPGRHPGHADGEAPPGRVRRVVLRGRHRLAGRGEVFPVHLRDQGHRLGGARVRVPVRVEVDEGPGLVRARGDVVRDHQGHPVRDQVGDVGEGDVEGLAGGHRPGAVRRHRRRRAVHGDRVAHHVGLGRGPRAVDLEERARPAVVVGDRSDRSRPHAFDLHLDHAVHRVHPGGVGGVVVHRRDGLLAGDEPLLAHPHDPRDELGGPGVGGAVAVVVPERGSAVLGGGDEVGQHQGDPPGDRVGRLRHSSRNPG